MDYYFNRSDRYRMPTFDCVKPAFKEPQVMMPFKVLEGYSFFQPKVTLGQAAGPFQPPRFIVGGFVGSKVCEHKNGSAGNYSDLLGTIINILTTFKPPQPSPAARHHSFRGSWPNRNAFSPSSRLSYAEVATKPPLQSAPSVPPPASVVPSIVIEKARPASPAPQKTCLPDPPPQVPQMDAVNMLSPVGRTLSESSDTSWASTTPSECQNLPSSNPWLKNMLVCVSDAASDDDDDDDDSDWDCVDDFQSENGEIISDFKWHHGDCLSPISSPTNRTPPAVDAREREFNGYDSDEDSEGGVYVSCNPYVMDEEEERRASEERLRAVNLRWEEGLAAGRDEMDSKTTQGKQVRNSFKPAHLLGSKMSLFLYRSTLPRSSPTSGP